MRVEFGEKPLSQTERFCRRWGRESLLKLGLDVVEEVSSPTRKPETTFSWNRPSRGIGSIGQSSRRMSHGFKP